MVHIYFCNFRIVLSWVCSLIRLYTVTRRPSFWLAYIASPPFSLHLKWNVTIEIRMGGHMDWMYYFTTRQIGMFFCCNQLKKNRNVKKEQKWSDASIHFWNGIWLTSWNKWHSINIENKIVRNFTGISSSIYHSNILKLVFYSYSASEISKKGHHT
jgi:hypothetical protein